eukprot:scaffold251542_cov24-Tisochrysis_lutea.AAC.1
MLSLRLVLYLGAQCVGFSSCSRRRVPIPAHPRLSARSSPRLPLAPSAIRLSVVIGAALSSGSLGLAGRRWGVRCSLLAR